MRITATAILAFAVASATFAQTVREQRGTPVVPMNRLVTAEAVIVARDAATPAAQKPVDYDTFMQQDLQQRLRMFNEASPENRAELVRTHIGRWLAANQDRLTSEQIAVIRENVAFIQADVYRAETRERYRSQADDLERRTAALLTRDDMRQALTINWGYLPKQ